MCACAKLKSLMRCAACKTSFFFSLICAATRAKQCPLKKSRKTALQIYIYRREGFGLMSADSACCLYVAHKQEWLHLWPAAEWRSHLQGNESEKVLGFFFFRGTKCWSARSVSGPTTADDMRTRFVGFSCDEEIRKDSCEGQRRFSLWNNSKDIL